MESFQQFLHMGGYAEYVWSAYALTAIVLGLNALSAWRAETAELVALARRAANQESQ